MDDDVESFRQMVNSLSPPDQGLGVVLAIGVYDEGILEKHTYIVQP